MNDGDMGYDAVQEASQEEWQRQHATMTKISDEMVGSMLSVFHRAGYRNKGLDILLTDALEAALATFDIVEYLKQEGAEVVESQFTNGYWWTPFPEEPGVYLVVAMLSPAACTPPVIGFW